MEKYSTRDVTELLRQEGLPEMLLDHLAGMNKIYSNCSGPIIDINFLLTENCIDGTALAALPEDIEEFKILIPQSGLRIRLKAIIKKYMDSPVVTVCACTLYLPC